MSEHGSYWDKILRNRLSRRRALAASGGLAIGAAILSACGGGDDDKGGGGEQAGLKPAGKLDASKGTPGGKLIWQPFGDAGTALEMLKIRSLTVYNMASLTHDGLLDYAYGVQGYPGIGAEVLPSLATNVPEVTPDKIKFTFKIRQGVKFHNGDALTAEDARWTFDALGVAASSPWKGDYPFMDKVEAVDATTFVVTNKFPHADFNQSMAFKNGGAIMNRRHYESADGDKKLVGTGPYTFVDYIPPTVSHYKKNPEYWGKPLGFFDEVERLGTQDKEKHISDFISKQVHLTYWFTPVERDRIKQQRPDAQLWTWTQAGSHNLYMRNDKAPFTDKRVRQALSMTIDRKALVGPMTNGEGEAEGLMGLGAAWKFRRPAELGTAAKYFTYDLTAAKALLTAAGVTLPIKLGEIPTWNATVVGPANLDALTLITTAWKNNGIADATIKEENFGQFVGRLIGNMDYTAWGPNTQATNPDMGATVKGKYYWPESATDKPVGNQGWVKNAALNALLDKQVGEFDRTARQKVLTELEDLLSEEMLHIPSITGKQSYFADPSLKNAQMPRDAFNGGAPWLKYWWFEKKA